MRKGGYGAGGIGGAHLYPNIDLRAHLTIWGAVFAGCLAVFLTLAAPVWVWLPMEIWLVLWGCAILALHADAYWPARLVTILRDPDFKQVYQWVTVPLLARVWRRLCDHNPASSSAAATFGAALTARLYDRALLIAVAYPVLFPVLIWVATGRAGQMGPVTFLPGTDAWDVWPERTGCRLSQAQAQAQSQSHSQAQSHFLPTEATSQQPCCSPRHGLSL